MDDTTWIIVIFSIVLLILIILVVLAVRLGQVINPSLWKDSIYGMIQSDNNKGKKSPTSSSVAKSSSTDEKVSSKING